MSSPRSTTKTRRSPTAASFPSSCFAGHSTSRSSPNRCNERLAEGGGVDPSRTALIGYSMGGYGVLTAAGGELDPGSPLAQDGAGRPLVTVRARRRPTADSVRVASVKAVVAISPAGGSLQAWGAERDFVPSRPRCCSSPATAMEPSITRTGARAFFDMAKNSPRYLLTFRVRGTPHRPRAGA